MTPLLEQYGQASEFLKLLANPNRLAVLCTIQDNKHNVGELAQLLDMPQAALSNQLSLLREAGLVDCEIRHRERLYYIADPRVHQMIALLHRFFCADSDSDNLPKPPANESQP